MKKVKLFEEFVNEFNYGKELLSDPLMAHDPRRLKDLGLKYEPNTISEEDLIQLLKDWFSDEQYDSKLGKFLNELLPLKNKFPKVLDPKLGRNLYEGTDFFRGTTLPLKEVLNMKGSWKRYKGLGLFGAAIELNSSFSWQQKSAKGFTSFSPAIETAQEFADNISYEEYKPYRPGYVITDNLSKGDTSGNVPVILKIKDTHPQALFNPQFTTAISPFLTEYEVFMVGTRFQIDGLIIPRWDEFEQGAEAVSLDLNKYFNLK